MHQVDAIGCEGPTREARRRWTAASAIGSSRPAARLIAAFAAVGTMWIGISTDVPIATATALVALIPAALVDLVDRRLPDRLVASAAMAFVAVTAVSAVFQQRVDVIGALLGAVAMASPLLVLHLASPASMGFGDVKVGAVIGMALGLTDPLLALVALCIGSALSAVVALARNERSVAFGPGLVGGAMVALVCFVSPAYGLDAPEAFPSTNALATGSSHR